MVKKLTALVLVLVSMLPCLQKPLVVMAEATDAKLAKYNAIIDEVLTIDQSIDTSNNNLYVVSVMKQEISRGQLDSTESTELAIRMITQKNTITEVTTFFPYKITKAEIW